MTDRQYMQRLQRRILEDHLETQRRRIQQREADEAERERRLLLQGKLDPAALAASDNPAPALALRLSQLSRWLTDDPARTQEAKRRFNRQHRGQAQRAGRQQQQQLEDQQQQQQAEEGDSWEMGPSCDAPSRQLSATEEPPDGGERRKSRQQGRADSGAGDEEDSGFTQADYERLKYEAPLVKQLRSLETLDEMYSLAEEIVGPLRPVRAAKTAKGAF